MSLKYYFTLVTKTLADEGWVSVFKKTGNVLKVKSGLFLRNILNKLAGQRFVLKSRNQISKSVSSSFSPEDMPFVDIIIVTYNSQDDISHCIGSIQKQRYPEDKISIVIVDSSSSDNTREVVESIQSGVRNLKFIESPVNKGFGASNNIGFKSTSSEYVLYLNPDTELKSDTLFKLVSAALETKGDGFCAWEARQQPYEHPKIYDPVTLETEWVSGACFLAAREAFEKVGGFDENIFLYGEDVDLSWRLRGAGYKLQYIPSAVVNHFTYADESAIKPTQFINSIISNGILRYKFGNFSDLLVYYFGIILVLTAPTKIKRIRFSLIAAVLKTFSKNIKAMAWKHANRKKFSGIPRFNGWEFEFRRRGAFYINKPTDEKPLVSVIIRTTQRPYFLGEALQSVRNQTYVPIEDGEAKSSELINEFSDIDIKYISTGARVGRSRAGNLGIRKAIGKYLNFLDDDDLFFSDHFEILVSELETDKLSRMAAYSTGFEVPTEVISLNPFRYKEIDYRIVFDKSFDREALKKLNYIPINCMMFSHELFLKEGGLDETLDLIEDWDLWLRYSQYGDFLFVEKTTCIYRVPAVKKNAQERQELLDKAYRHVTMKFP